MSETTSTTESTPAAADGGPSGPSSGGSSPSGSAPAGGGEGGAVEVVVDMPSYEGDVAAMRAHTTFLDTVVLPHFEGLINAAGQQEMGADLIQNLNEGLEKVRDARTRVALATNATVTLNEAVAQAHADAASAAKKKSYYQGE